MEILIAAKADLILPARWLVVQPRFVKAIRTLIAAGVNIEAADQNGNTPLMQAAVGGHVEIVRMLIAANADVNAVDQGAQTALYCAIQAGSIEVLQMLLEKNANVNVANQVGTTPLMFALLSRHVGAMQVLLSANADVNAVDQQGNTVLMVAAGIGNVDVVRLLIAAGATINILNKNRISALGHVTSSEVVQLIIDSYRVELAQRFPENLMEYFLRDYEQFNGGSELQSMGNAFNQVGELITSYLSGNDRRNLVNTGCGVLVKSTVNGKNGQSPVIKKRLFAELIISTLKDLILLKEAMVGLKEHISLREALAGNDRAIAIMGGDQIFSLIEEGRVGIALIKERVLDHAEKVIPLLTQQLAQGYYIHEREAQAAPAAANDINDVCAQQMDIERARVACENQAHEEQWRILEEHARRECEHACIAHRADQAPMAADEPASDFGCAVAQAQEQPRVPAPQNIELEAALAAPAIESYDFAQQAGAIAGDSGAIPDVLTEQDIQMMREQRIKRLGGQVVDRKGKGPAA